MTLRCGLFLFSLCICISLSCCPYSKALLKHQRSEEVAGWVLVSRELGSPSIILPGVGGFGQSEENQVLGVQDAKSIGNEQSITVSHGLSLKQGIWMHPAQIPRADCCSLSSSVRTGRSELWHQSRHADPPGLNISCRETILLAWSSWSLGKAQMRIPVGFDRLNTNFLSSSGFFLPLFPVLQDRPQEKPICIFISNLDQLRAAAPPISPLLWEFMERVYPGGIGCIIKKGEWLKKLGEMNGTALLPVSHGSNTAGLQSFGASVGRDSVHFILRNQLGSLYMPW